MVKQEWYLQHGWGLDASCFESWKEILPPSIECLIPDSGYWGERKETSFKEADSLKVVVAHSFGLFLLPTEILRQAQVLCLIGSFLSFPNELQDAALQVQQNLFFNPLQTVKNHISLCYHPYPPQLQSPKYLDVFKLSHDLNRLKQEEFSWETLLHIPKVIVFHGLKDAIVPLTKAQEICEKLPNAHLIPISDGSHALPLTHPEFCTHTIRLL